MVVGSFIVVVVVCIGVTVVACVHFLDHFLDDRTAHWEAASLRVSRYDGLDPVRFLIQDIGSLTIGSEEVDLTN